VLQVITISEKTLSALASSAISGSFAFALLAFVMILGLPAIVAWDKGIVASSWFQWGAILFASYCLSLYAVASVPGKSRGRKLLSWGFAAALHAFVIAYAAIVWRGGLAVAILLLSEIAAVLLCVTGLIFALNAHGKEEDYE
jgi:hypothetical protein